MKSLVLLQSLLVVGNEEAAIINPARLDPGLSLEAGEDLVGVAQQLDLRVVGSQSPDQAGSVPGGSWELQRVRAGWPDQLLRYNTGCPQLVQEQRENKEITLELYF